MDILKRYLPPICFTHTSLLVMLIALFFQPLLSGFALGRVMFDALVFVIFALGMAVVHEGRRERIIAFFLALVPVFARGSEGLHFHPETMFLVANLFSALFLGFTAAALLLQIIRTQIITHDTLAAAVSLYLLVGITFAFVFASINVLHPGSFALQAASSHGAQLSDTRTFIYFSFVTLTTVGFGDTVPLTDLARSFTILEAICGQMFLAILVSSIVGKKLSRSF